MIVDDLAASGRLGSPFRVPDSSPAVCLPILNGYLHTLLNNGDLREAASLLWTPSQFNPNPRCSQDVWRLFDDSAFGLIMGAASMSKSFTMGVRLFLEWIRDPEFTTIKVIGPAEDHLEQNLFSHLVALHKQSSLPLPGEVGSLYIGLDRRNQLSAIRGVVIPVGNVKKAGRLQGAKRKPRPAEHPVFGILSRMFIFIDEIENVPKGLWSDIDNVMANTDEDLATQGLKIFGAYNPTNPADEVGKRAEPPGGWESFDINSDYRWKSKRGWDVLRLDGEKSENVVQGTVVYPGLQTRSGLDRIALNSGGTNSPGYMAMGRGAYPLTGVEMTIIPPGMFSKSRGEAIWFSEPVNVGSVDLALEGKASAIFSLGQFGLASGVRYLPTSEHPQGETRMFRNAKGQSVPRHVLMLKSQLALPKGETFAMGGEVVRIAKVGGIRPECLTLDRTGHGQGVYDYVRHHWSASVCGVNYSEGPSTTRILTEDMKTCAEAYSRVCCELWFALRKFMEFGVLIIHPSVDLSQLTSQVTQRRFRSLNGKDKVETKKDYTLRGFPSPDEADSLTLLVHSVRIGLQFIPSMFGGADIGEDQEEDWPESLLPDGGARIDESNRSQYLDESVDDHIRAAYPFSA